MPFELDATINPAVAPLAWMVGRWEGVGVVGYPDMESRNFGQELTISHDTRPFLEVDSRAFLLAEDGSIEKPLAREVGFFRVLEGGEIELLLAHPTGIVEMYAGEREEKRPVLNLRTDGVMRSPAAREYTAATRMYGLVENKLMWVMDMAAEGHPLTSHLSAQLSRVG
ncbi:FABP family protein [Mobilicoccus caccae]|uniref:Peroxynitrite isomerase n=1 Tax=Mobilicoccus caccae TaxID=1859295 RepID=A0ABQ6IVB5_9MICO|nr:FABP family protein [Mobilicoccus caccae]GMA40996.1 UPF0678 fatty acid-binding protein-like protein [Mobilicoccus caccae]